MRKLLTSPYQYNAYPFTPASRPHPIAPNAVNDLTPFSSVRETYMLHVGAVDVQVNTRQALLSLANSVLFVVDTSPIIQRAFGISSPSPIFHPPPVHLQMLSLSNCYWCLIASPATRSLLYSSRDSYLESIFTGIHSPPMRNHPPNRVHIPQGLQC